MPWTVMSILHSESVASPEAIGVVSGDCHASRQGCPGETGRGARAHRGFLARSVPPSESPEAAGAVLSRDFDVAMTISHQVIVPSLRSVPSGGPHKESVKLSPEPVQHGHVRLAVPQQAREVSEKLVAAGARHHD